MADIVAASSGDYHSLALRVDGTVWTWGRGDVGQLGIGTAAVRERPVLVQGLEDMVAVAGGGLHSLALKADGTVWAWGFGRYGQLGDGQVYDGVVSGAARPVAVGLTDVRAISSGYYHSLALKTDGTVWAWGSGSAGQLGNGGTSNSNVPVQVSGLTNVIAIASGYYHNLALKADGTVWAWGYRAYGQLGDGQFSNQVQVVPTQIAGLTGIQSIACGAHHSLASNAAGAVWAWGFGLNGQLGNGAFTHASRPVAVTGLTGVAVVSATAYSSAGIQANGSLWTWGSGSNGELGDGKSYDAAPYGVAVPLRVNRLTPVLAISSGGYHRLVVTGGNRTPVASAGGPYIGREGTPIRFAGAGSDPDGDPNLQYHWDFGDGATGKGANPEHVYANNGVYTVTLSVTDTHGAAATGTGSVTVSNVAPSVSAGSDVTLREGEALSQNGSFTDPGADTWTATVDYGDGTGPRELPLSGKTFSLGYTYPRSGRFTVTFQVRDSDGDMGTGAFRVTVDNLAPQVLGAPSQTVVEEQRQNFTLGEFSDAAGDGPWNVSVDWGDGSADEFVVASPGKLPARPHVYTAMGNYAVHVAVRDRVGVTGRANFSIGVRNAAPEITPPTAPAAVPVYERVESKFKLGSFADSARSAPWSVMVDWGDGQHASWTADQQGSLGERAHTYQVAGEYTIIVTVVDRDGAEDKETFPVTVQSVAPRVTAPTSQTTVEGVGKPFDLGSFTDLNGDGPWQVTVDWGDGQTQGFTTAAAGTLGVRIHEYPDNGKYTVHVTVTDRAGDAGSNSFEATVANAAPVVSASADQTLGAGETRTFDLGSFVDVAGDGPWNVQLDWGDGQTENFTVNARGALGARQHTFAQIGTSCVELSVTDKDNETGSATFTVTVNNAAPVMARPADQTSTEGEAKSFDLGSFTDAAGDGSWNVKLNWGDGKTEEFTVTEVGSLGTRSHVYVNDGSYVVSISMRDKVDAASTTGFTVSVANAAPVATILAPSAGMFVTVGQSVTLSGRAMDAGRQDQLTAEWLVTGEGDPVRVAANRGADGAVTGNIAFNQAGTYVVTLRVQDEDGGVTEASTIGGNPAQIRVFSVQGGIVKGDVWLANGTPKDTSVKILGTVKSKTGKATGKIVVNDKPTGLKLTANKLETVAFAPGKVAYLRGRGKFKKREYTVVAVVVDGMPDRIRLKVTDALTGAVVLDSQPGTLEAAAATTPLKRGNVVVITQ